MCIRDRVRSWDATLKAIPRTKVSTSKTGSSFLDGIPPWGLWTLRGVLGLCLIIAAGVLVYVCVSKRKVENEVEPLSSSEEEALRTQSIDLATRRMELLSNLYQHRVNSPDTRITRSMSRSREGLESIRQRQRTQSGDALDGASNRQRTQSGDLVQDEKQHRERANTSGVVLDGSRDMDRERHTSLSLIHI